MEPAIATGLFALGGVITGGLLNGGVSFALDRARGRGEGRAAALLVTEELMGSMPALLELGKAQTWGALSQDYTFGRRTLWEENRSSLARVLSADAYMTLGATYNGLSSAASRAASEDKETRLTDAEGQALATAYLTLNRGLTYLGPLMQAPPGWRLRARRAFITSNREHREKLLREDVSYQAFMAKHGRDE